VKKGLPACDSEFVRNIPVKSTTTVKKAREVLDFIPLVFSKNSRLNSMFQGFGQIPGLSVLKKSPVKGAK